MKAGLDRLEGTDIRIEVRAIDGEEGFHIRLPVFEGASSTEDEPIPNQTAVVEP